MTADLSLPETPERIFRELQGRGITVDVLVNNAGFGAWGKFAGLPLPRQLEMLQVNITALVQLTGLFLPGMVQRRRGGILNVASVAGFVPGPGMAVYYATKACVLSFTEALAEELAGTNVTVTALCPGPTATNFGKVATGRPGTDGPNGQNVCGSGCALRSSLISEGKGGGGSRAAKPPAYIACPIWTSLNREENGRQIQRNPALTAKPG